MGISRHAIEFQMQKIDPAAHAARLADHARVEAEAAAAEASGKNVEFVFVERGGSSSAKRALGKLEKRLKGNAVWVRNKLEDLIHDFGRDDWVNYKPLLVQFFRLFGKGIHESLTRTCSDQLSHLTGCYSAEGAEAWMRAKAPDLLNENDLAETPFAKVPLI